MTHVHRDRCAAAVINGIPCHKHGCPANQVDLATGNPYVVESRECGCEFAPVERGQNLCSEECASVFWG